MKMIVSCCMFTMLLLLILPFQAVSAVTITTPPLITDGGVDTPYTFSFIASGGTTPYTWEGTGILPPGLSLTTDPGTNNGVLSGTPTSSGSYDFTVKVTDSTSGTPLTASKQIFMNVTSMPVAMPSSHPNEYGNCTTCHGGPNLTPVTSFTSKPAILTSYNNATFEFSADKTATFVCSLDGAAWAPCASPTGFTGLAVGSHIFKVRATDSSGNVEFPPASYRWEITNPSIIIITTDSALSPATIGAPYSQTLDVATGNHTVFDIYWYTDNLTTLPAGLSLDNVSGVISGIPSETQGTYPATYNFTVTVAVTDQDYSVRLVSKDFTITINDHSALAITTASLPSGTEGADYSQTVVSAGGVPGYAWSMVSGSGNLPPGLSLTASTGKISGKSLGFSAGTYTFTLAVTDSDLPTTTVTRPFSITINPALAVTTASPLPSGTVAVSYSQTLSAANGLAPYTWSTSSNLPAGLTLSSNGIISGLPETAGTYHLLFYAEESPPNSRTANKSIDLVIIDHPQLAITTSLPNGTVGVSYSQILATGGITPYTLTLISGTLPPGLNVNSTGVISGSPTTAGTYTAYLRVDDTLIGGHDHYTNRTVSITINPPLTVTTASLPSAIAGTAYSQSPAASGGVTPYTWTHSGGTLPPGLTLNAGVISGTPTTAGTYEFSLTVHDSATQAASKAFTIVIHSALTITTASLPSGIAGTAYSQSPTASGGVTPYTWTHSGGTLPPGLTLNAGVISGTPTTAGSYEFSLTVHDSATQSASKAFTIVIHSALTITTASLPSGIAGTAYSQSPTASGGVTPYTWTHSGGTLPPGLTLNAGVISGTPTTAGSYEFTLTVNDSSIQSSSNAFTVVIASATPSIPPITVPGLPGTYTSITSAYAAVTTNGTINMASGSFTENLDFNLSTPFTLKGGYDSATGTYSGTSTITGTLTVSRGSLTIENIVIK